MSSSFIEQHNLYINIEKYNIDYNFYNYNKFSIQKKIPITYRSPTLFLDGLYFELPKSRILSINKNAKLMSYNINIEISMESDIYNILKKINKYNLQFFKNNMNKFILKVNKSNKRTFYRNEEVETKFTPPIKNPLIKEYIYKPFYKVNEDNKSIKISIKIKHNYLLKIIELILLNNSNTNKCIFNKINKLHSLLVNTEYFELKNMDVEYILDDIDLFIKFWVKVNNFIGDEKNQTINMNWNICDYNL
jgi:hypothetical protein